ncbi:MAG: hypothetical protein ABJO09_17085 [Hyphomicrobiales bacterium]
MSPANADAAPFKFDLDLSQNALTMEERFKELQVLHAETLEKHKVDLQAAKKEGEEIGRKSSEAIAAKALAEHMQKVVKSASGLLSSRSKMHETLERQTSTLALSIGKHLANAALKKAPHAEVEAMLIDAIGDLSNVPHLILHLPQITADEVRPKLIELLDDLGFAGRLIVKTEADWTEADIRLVWADGELVRDLNQAEAILQKEISSYFGDEA